GPSSGVLPTDHRCRWTRARNRVCVTVNELPASVLQSKHAGHADRNWCFVLSAPDLGSTPLHLDDAGERFGDILGDELDLHDLAVAVVRGGASKCLLHFLPPAYVRTKWVSQGHIVC